MKVVQVPNFHFVGQDIDRAYYFWNDALQLEMYHIGRQQGTDDAFDAPNTLKSWIVMLNTIGMRTSYDGLVNLGLGSHYADRNVV